jgi:hypothetical protein
MLKAIPKERVCEARYRSSSFKLQGFNFNHPNIVRPISLTLLAPLLSLARDTFFLSFFLETSISTLRDVQVTDKKYFELATAGRASVAVDSNP